MGFFSDSEAGPQRALQLHPFLDMLDIEGFLPASAGPLHTRLKHLSDARRRSIVSVQRLQAHASSMWALYESARRSQARACDLQRLFTRHAREQHALVASLADRVRTLGADTSLPGTGSVMVQNTWRDDAGALRRVVEMHGLGLSESDTLWRQASLDGDDATCALIADEVVRTNERQSWLAAEQLVSSAGIGASRQRGVAVCRGFVIERAPQ